MPVRGSARDVGMARWDVALKNVGAHVGAARQLLIERPLRGLPRARDTCPCVSAARWSPRFRTALPALSLCFEVGSPVCCTVPQKTRQE